MSSTNKTTYYELSQYIGTDKPTYLGDYNSDMLAIDTAIHGAADDASTAVSTANTANATATTASTNATSALSTANTALETANTASTTATTASTNASAALTAAQAAQTASAANTITNLAPAYDSTLTYAVGDLVTYIDDQGSGKLYKCIVAVSTPEAFNINKWDDVTVSAVFKPNTRIISQVAADGVLTINDILLSLFENFSTADFDYVNHRYSLVVFTGTEFVFYDLIAANTNQSNPYIQFVNCRTYYGVDNLYHTTRNSFEIYYPSNVKTGRKSSINESYNDSGSTITPTITLSTSVSEVPSSDYIYYFIEY